MRVDTNSSAYRGAYLAALLARHYPDAAPHAVACVVVQMQRAAKAAKAWEERRYNVPLSKAQEEAGQRRMGAAQLGLNRVLEYASLICAPDRGTLASESRRQPATVSLGGDPRGPCARLHIPGQPGDGFGDGYAIY